jgi:hypothetical protein
MNECFHGFPCVSSFYRGVVGTHNNTITVDGLVKDRCVVFMVNRLQSHRILPVGTPTCTWLSAPVDNVEVILPRIMNASHTIPNESDIFESVRRSMMRCYEGEHSISNRIFSALVRKCNC